MKFRPRWLIALSLAGSLALLAQGPCHEFRALEPGLLAFDVRVTAVEGATGGDGTAANPYAVPQGSVTFVFDAAAIDKRGQRLDGQDGRPSFDASALVLVRPPGRSLGDGQAIAFQAGVAQGGRIEVRRVYGRVALEIVDVRLVPGEPVPGPLRDLPQWEQEGSFAMGVSQPIHFRSPTLRDAQVDDTLLQSGDNFGSALPNRFLEFDTQKDNPAGPFQDGHGQLLVTAVFNEGFYTTDLAAEPSQGFHHLYVYTYSYPDFLAVGDRLDELAGTSQDFSGCTQISFPRYRRAEDESHDPLPFRVADIDQFAPSPLLTTAMCQAGGGSNLHLCGYSSANWTLEALESARVRLEHIQTPDLHIDCDLNGDGEIPLAVDLSSCDRDCSDGACDLDCFEAACRDACLARNGTSISAKSIVAPVEVLRALALETCATDADCKSGQCGGVTDIDRDDGVCRAICPWEASLGDIRPNCIALKVAAGHVCSELSTLRLYGQWTGALDGGAGPLISLMTRESLVRYDPTAPVNLGRTVDFLQGNLRQVRAARPRWLVTVGQGAADAPASMRE